MRRLVPVLFASLVLVGACGGGSSKDNVGSAPSSSSTTRPGGSETTSKPSGPTTTVAPGKGSNSKAGSGAPIAQAAPDKLAPKDGSYEYVGTSTDSKGEQRQERSVLRVKTESRAGVVRQTHNQGNASGSTVNTVEWRADGLWVVDQHSEQGGDSGPTCDWNPDVLEWLLPFRVGATWNSESTCSQNDTAQTRKIDGKVVRAEDVTVAGRSVRAVVIERTRSTHLLLGGSVPLDRVERMTEWVSPENGLVLKSKSTISSSGAVTLGGSNEYTLQNLDPK